MATTIVNNTRFAALGGNAPETHTFRVFTQGQKRGFIDNLKKLMKRRAAVEPVIGHVKNEHRIDRNYLAGKAGDAINAILATAGYNFRLFLKWLKLFLRLQIRAIFVAQNLAQT